MSEAEWAVTEPVLPQPAWKQGRGGRPALHRRRDVVDAIRYLVREGIRWRAMPADFPHWRTVYDALDGWGKSGATGAMHDELRRQCRIAAGRAPEPTAAVIDSQSVRAAETIGRNSRGYDAAKKVQGRKRHIAVDVLGAVDVIGLLLTVLITAASVQDRDAARPPPHRPGLRAADRTPRDHYLLGHDHHHEPPPGPAAVTGPAAAQVRVIAGGRRRPVPAVPGLRAGHDPAGQDRRGALVVTQVAGPSRRAGVR